MSGERAHSGFESVHGREYYRSLRERCETGGATPELPPGTLAPHTLSRRAFLTLLGASAALAGAGGCLQAPEEKILPYTIQPPEVTPGIGQHYATTMELGGYGTGLLVESREGRPIKVEGNPSHPASLGAAGVYEQASLLALYDPHRLAGIRHRRAARSWHDVAAALAPEALRRRAPRLRILMPPTASPTVTALLARLRARLPGVRVHFHAPLHSDAPLAGAAAAFRRPLQAVYDFSRAVRILALDADFLGTMPFHLRHGRGFARRRRLEAPAGDMNRLYAAESALSVTGMIADHRLPVRSSEIPALLAHVAAELASAGLLPPPLRDRLPSPQGGRHVAWARAAARDLAAHRESAVVVAGERQPPHVHALAHAVNAALGGLGTTVRLIEPVLGTIAPEESLPALVEAIDAGQVETLVILGGNPCYDAPVDLDVPAAVRRVPHTLYLGEHDDETAAACHWLVPALHYLEAWGDARAFDGTPSVVQPLIRPLWGGRTTAEMLALLLGSPAAGAHELTRRHWQRETGLDGDDFERFWDRALERGVIDEPAPAVEASVRPAAVADALAAAEDALSPGAIEIDFRQDYSVYDGRFAPVPWLQELPDPVTKLTWDNAALLSPRTAERLGVETGERITVRHAGRRLRIVACAVPGHADDAVTLPLGYGHRGEMPVARGVGFDAYRLRTAREPHVTRGEIERGWDGEAGAYPLAFTQEHWEMHGRPIVLDATLAYYRDHPDFTDAHAGPTHSLYHPPPPAGDEWAMTIDLSLCTGCSACVVACQAENNIPSVGKDGVLASREMHWLRIDRYFAGDPAEPRAVTQPMLCQHCEMAPCEYVCPVNATVHSPDGLNEMIYNRCVGTRFCSNNCPYKVRRFNWFDLSASRSETERMALNPDVTVRARGVMEKCTYCVQRIRRSQIAARIEGRPLRPGEVRTACQQACPTEAIVFGSLHDADSALVRSRRQDRLYSVLHELGTEPRTKYLARIRNPNPALEET